MFQIDHRTAAEMHAERGDRLRRTAGRPWRRSQRRSTRRRDPGNRTT